MERDDRRNTKTEDASTAPGRDGAAVQPDFAEWEAYEILARIGQGGMGAVYKARHRALGRIVALKFILAAHPKLVARFLQEARAQARIDHPNVCRVYEVGELNDRPYIAMQFVDGEQLGTAAHAMSLDDKVLVMRDIAAAVHEAHKLGIVHRDLKPSNIVVERSDDGRWFPVVMDFGLAREATDGGLTESGALMGTPAYMAPEQARGQFHLIDRRSDVYSLGSTLYEILTGQPPFPQASTALVLHQLLNHDPPPPRRIAPHLPVDLETIVMQCLAKDPERRYPSARALADDLGRYSEGAPIFGRRPSLIMRLRARMRRNRPLVVALAASLAIIVAVAGLGVRAALLSRQRARLADTLARASKDMEWRLDAAHLAPLHDTTPERELLEKRMKQIAATPHELGALGDGTIHEAVGRGYLALHEWQHANDELLQAEKCGLDHPSLHYARGRALGELYHRAREDARYAGDKAWLARREREIDRELSAPALAELERSRAGNDSDVDPQTLEALMALYRRDYDNAERLALAASAAAPPWSYDARRIAADAVSAAAVDDLDHGRYAEAERRLDRAGQLYEDAAAVGRSDATTYASAAKALQARAELDQRRGRTPKATLERALAALDHALAADPQLGSAYVTRAYVLMFWYRVPALRSPELPRILDEAARAARRATEINVRDARAWDVLGTAYLYRGFYEMRPLGDSVPWLHDARAALERALVLEPNDPWANNDVGVAHRWLGSYLQDAGRDPTSEYAAARKSFERATAIDPEYVFAYANQVDVAAAQAELRVLHGIDPSEAIARAQHAGDQCLAIDPSFYKSLYNLVAAYLSEAKYLLLLGRDPDAALAQVRKYDQQLIRLQPDSWSAYYWGARAALDEARYRLSVHAASSALAQGREQLARALAANGDAPNLYIVSAELALLEARQAEAQGRASRPALQRALADAQRAVALDGGDSEAAVACAQAYARLARTAKGAAVRSLLDAGLAIIDKAIALNPDLAEAYLTRAQLLSCRAELVSDEPARAKAQQAAARAFAINPLLQRQWRLDSDSP